MDNSFSYCVVMFSYTSISLQCYPGPLGVAENSTTHDLA